MLEAMSTTATDRGAELEFGELDDMVGIALIRAYNGAYRYFYRSMDPEMKPGFFTSLALIDKNPGLTQKALAKAIRRDPSTVVPILDAFEKQGWIIRKRSAQDRRAHALYLTPAGRRAARRFRRKVAAIEASIEAELGRQKSRDLKALLKKLEQFFDQQSG